MSSILTRAVACSPTWTAIRAGQRQPEALEAACGLFRDWSGRPMDATTRRRLALRLGCGRTPNEAAALELGYSLSRALDCPTAGRGWHGALVGL